MSKKEVNLKKRQYKYKIGSIIRFGPDLSWYDRIRNKIEIGDLGIVISVDNYGPVKNCKVKHLKSGSLGWFNKNNMRLVSKEEAIMESL